MGATSNGRAILAPKWVEVCALLGTVPKACRPHRAQTKGKVERLIRELKESFLPWLQDQLLPPEPTLDDHDLLVRRWVREVVMSRRQRTRGTGGGRGLGGGSTAATPDPRSSAGQADRASSGDHVVTLRCRSGTAPAG